VPLVAGAAIAFDGQVSVYDTRTADTPCYACVFPPEVAPPEARCATMGVFAPLTGILGALQAAEALKLLVGIGGLNGCLLRLDALTMESRIARIVRDPACVICGVQSAVSAS